MSKPFFFRSILALTLIAGVSACQSTGMPASEQPAVEPVAAAVDQKEALVPVDLIALRDSYLDANPDKRWLELDGRL